VQLYSDLEKDASGTSAARGKFSESGEFWGKITAHIASFDFSWGHQAELSDFPI